MKKILFLIIIFSFLAAGSMVSAQEDGSLNVNKIELPTLGVTPDSSFYFLKTWKESIQTFFTFGAENKANQFLHLSEVRLAEYLKMIEKGKTKLAEKTLEKYTKQFNQALEKSEGQAVIYDKILIHKEILKNVLQEAPESAKAEIEKAIENSNETEVKVKQKIEEALNQAPPEVQSCFKSTISEVGEEMKSGEFKGEGDIQTILLNCLAPGKKIPSGRVFDVGFLKGMQEFYGKSLPTKDSDALNKLIEQYKDKLPQEAEIPSSNNVLNLEEIKKLQQKTQEEYNKLTPVELEYIKKMQEQGQFENTVPIEIQGSGSGMGL